MSSNYQATQPTVL